MTCIAGAIKGSEVWIGADAVSAHSNGEARISTQAKVFQVEVEGMDCIAVTTSTTDG